jgi:hypothetical protein
VDARDEGHDACLTRREIDTTRDGAYRPGGPTAAFHRTPWLPATSDCRAIREPLTRMFRFAFKPQAVHRGGSNAGSQVHLEPVDATDMAEMLTFVSHWLAEPDNAQLTASFGCFTGTDRYDLTEFPRPGPPHAPARSRRRRTTGMAHLRFR